MPQQAKAPFQIRDEVLSAIRQAIVTLKSPECMLIVAKADRAVKNNWATTLLRCAEARNELELATLKEIRDGLKENEKELTQGAESIKKALDRLKRLKQVLETIASFLDVVAKAAALVI